MERGRATTNARIMPLDRDAYFAALIPRINDFVREQTLPSMAIGIVEAGELIWTHGSGERVRGSAAPPSSDSIFRIASMTKSFTAAAILLLRDRGALRLDDALDAHLPWTASIGAPPNAAAITIRDLLTMNAGLPTDDPWGDRQESASTVQFDALASGGLSFTRAARTGFEYSNLSYALLGRVISVASQTDYLTFVKRELLEPLGMRATCFDTACVDERQRAPGYMLVDGDLICEPPVRPGAFSPMGGLHSSVRDIARWVRGFASPAAGASGTHPLSESSRREMQEGRTHAYTTLVAPTDSAPAKTQTGLYGYGLACESDSRLGRFVHHSGGYPGFGSHMRWHPASGFGIVALANRTYAPTRMLAAAILDGVVTDLAASLDPAAALWPQTRHAMDVVERLTAGWDDALADANFAGNVDLDLPRARRRAAFERAAAALGTFERIADNWISHSPAHVRWPLRGAQINATLEVLLTPERPPRIQLLTIELATIPRLDIACTESERQT